jgi:hypothetical protein
VTLTMARGKVTIFLNQARNTERITWSATGQLGNINLNNSGGTLDRTSLTTGATSDALIAALLTEVITQL